MLNRLGGEEALNARIGLASRSDVTVLITGPTGSGKTTLAREIHEKSSRKSGPFVTVNLASMHEGTIESELFGYERGAFTGADKKRIGKLALSNSGTLFLDEIGELSLVLQARLLEFLHSKCVTPLGSNFAQKVDVRIIAATHRALPDEVKNGRFREDLLHRIRVLELKTQSVRELKAKGPHAFEGVVEQMAEEISASQRVTFSGFSFEAQRLLKEYPWPGNFRELRSVLECALLSKTTDLIDVADIPPWVRGINSNHAGDPGEAERLRAVPIHPELGFHQNVAIFELEYLRWALSINKGAINRTARHIGLAKGTLLQRIKFFGIKPETYKKPLLAPKSH